MNLKTWKSPRIIAGLVGVSILTGSFIFYFSTTATAAYIVVNNEKIGLTPSISSGKKLVQETLEEYGQTVNQIAQTKQTIEYQKVRVNRNSLLEEDLTKEELLRKLNPYVEGYALEISGETVAILPHEEDIQTALEEYKSTYTTTDDSKQIITIEISDNISINKIETQPEEIQSPNQVVEMLKAGKQHVQEYTVEPNDSWWLIARKNNMLTQEVLNSNPDLAEDASLQPGQKLKLVSNTPYMDVTLEGKYSTTEIIPFDVTTEQDSTLPSGQSKIKKEGNDGSKIVTYSFIEKNGKTLEKKVLDEQVTQEPVNQVIAKGSKVVIASTPKASPSNLSRGSGRNTGFIWPLRGTITSYYGWRSRGFHQAIDIDGYTGDPIVAAASGKVVEARSAGNYGLMVLIDHGNGIATRYSHASKLLVSPGQTVNQGQTIALVGSTGNSTGSHLDFEVIVNGSPVNPLNYLP